MIASGGFLGLTLAIPIKHAEAKEGGGLEIARAK
jgi:hypothetical protein